jgi:hypothetical protein
MNCKPREPTISHDEIKTRRVWRLVGASRFPHLARNPRQVPLDWRDFQYGIEARVNNMKGYGMTNKEIVDWLATLQFNFDKRKSPTTHRQGQFVRGWKDAARSYGDAEDTMRFLTWRNLGFRFGRDFTSASEDDAREAWDRLASYYETNSK